MQKKISNKSYLYWTNRQRKTGQRRCMSMHLTPQAFQHMPDEKKEDSIFLGWEWEIDTYEDYTTDPSATPTAMLIKEAMRIPELRKFVNFGYLGRPIEMRSIPATMKFHRDYMKRCFFGNNLHTKYLRPPTGCGIHVHIDKKAFDKLSLGKFIHFLCTPENQAFVSKIAGRAVSVHADWCKPNNLPVELDDELKAINLPDGAPKRKSVAINTDTGFDTVELRIFASVLTERAFLKNLEFVDALIRYVRVHSLSDLKPEPFARWVIQKADDYPNLVTIIQRKRSRLHELVKGIYKEAKAKRTAKRPKVSQGQVA